MWLTTQRHLTRCWWTLCSFSRVKWESVKFKLSNSTLFDRKSLKLCMGRFDRVWGIQTEIYRFNFRWFFFTMTYSSSIWAHRKVVKFRRTTMPLRPQFELLNRAWPIFLIIIVSRVFRVFLSSFDSHFSLFPRNNGSSSTKSGKISRCCRRRRL